LSRFFIERSFCGFNAVNVEQVVVILFPTTTHNRGVLSYSVRHLLQHEPDLS
jgi:hypothetical protein